MKNKKVLLEVENPKLFSQLYLKLKELGFEISQGEESVKVTDHGMGDVVLDRVSNLSNAVSRIYLKSLGKERFDELLIGIDTNKERLTVAVIADGKLMESREVGLEAVAEYIEDVLLNYPHKRVYLGVGAGNETGKKAFQYLRKIFPYAKMVDESKTSGRSPYVDIRDRDLRAAYKIALRSTL
ncbi:hypothetical protein GWK48_03560 [Metallosphaera tengchongensis]|uniref:YqgF/RNase H-like domain-containing protein n=1 Tax=Metallosphaera tengchongensis TaxID=1532350 RepID=A0A6N0NS55_9CREN|nr:hypothetical protein [Metallosphaera tengchongensis]QKQ99595.1 hypothetical protein GWK48_03560 [Metallosphaera tengchongensis]